MEPNQGESDIVISIADVEKMEEEGEGVEEVEEVDQSEYIDHSQAEEEEDDEPISESEVEYDDGYQDGSPPKTDDEEDLRKKKTICLNMSQIHRDSKTPVSNFNCYDCRYLTQHESLEDKMNHILVHHYLKIVCPVCSDVLISAMLFVKHMFFHAPAKIISRAEIEDYCVKEDVGDSEDEDDFSGGFKVTKMQKIMNCEYCGKSYFTMSRLRAHFIRSHKDEMEEEDYKMHHQKWCQRDVLTGHGFQRYEEMEMKQIEREVDQMVSIRQSILKTRLNRYEDPKPKKEVRKKTYYTPAVVPEIPEEEKIRRQKMFEKCDDGTRLRDPRVRRVMNKTRKSHIDPDERERKQNYYCKRPLHRGRLILRDEAFSQVSLASVTASSFKAKDPIGYKDMCHICNCSFDDDRDTVAHLKDEHFLKANFQESSLQDRIQSLESKMNRNRYRLKHGITLYNFVCATCNGKYKTKHFLAKHRMSVHQEETVVDGVVIDPNEKDPCIKTSFPCYFCDQMFISNINRRKHVLSYHVNVQYFKCDFPDCKVQTNQFRRMLVHRRKMHLHIINKEQCPHCHKMFVNVKNHIYKVHRDRKLKECPVCGIQMATERLREHINKYHAVNPIMHECQYCARRFWVRGNMLIVSRHLCPVCPSNTYPSFLSQHIRSQHEDKKVRPDLIENNRKIDWLEKGKGKDKGNWKGCDESKLNLRIIEDPKNNVTINTNPRTLPAKALSTEDMDDPMLSRFISNKESLQITLDPVFKRNDHVDPTKVKIDIETGAGQRVYGLDNQQSLYNNLPSSSETVTPSKGKVPQKRGRKKKKVNEVEDQAHSTPRVQGDGIIYHLDPLTEILGEVYVTEQHYNPTETNYHQSIPGPSHLPPSLVTMATTENRCPLCRQQVEYTMVNNHLFNEHKIPLELHDKITFIIG